jgi:hypothetical protein
MSVQGVKFNPPYKDITDAIEKYNGVLANIARHFKVSRSTINVFINSNPELKQLVDIERAEYIETMCDDAEETINRLIKDKEEPAVALKAAQFALNNQARKRNYNHPEVEAAERSLGLLDKAKNLRVLPQDDNSAKPA